MAEAAMETTLSEADESERDEMLEALLAPIPGDDPCGISLRYENDLDVIREARRADNPDLPQGVWKTELKLADWPRVRDLSMTTLAERSKDLHCAVWLTEAWLHLDGFQGFRRGIDLIASLCEEYWQDLHPRIDTDGDLDFRLGPLIWAARNFPPMLSMIPITRPEGGDGRPLALIHWQDALRRENIAKRDAAAAKRDGRDKPGRADFEASVSLTAVDFYEAAARDLEGALGEVERLDRFLDETCPGEAPSLSGVLAVLSENNERVRLYVQNKGGRLPDADLDDEEDAAADAAETQQDPEEDPDMAASETAMPAGGAGDAIRGRAEAYRRLSEIADYLIRTEPHSPVPYLVRRAVAWGDMSFGELLVELVEGGGDHKRVLHLLGLDEMGKPRT